MNESCRLPALSRRAHFTSLRLRYPLLLFFSSRLSSLSGTRALRATFANLQNARYCDEAGPLSSTQVSSALHLVSARAEPATNSVLLWLHRVPLAEPSQFRLQSALESNRHCVRSLRDFVGGHVRRAALMSLDGTRERKSFAIDVPLAIPLGHIAAFRIGWSHESVKSFTS